MNKITLGEYIDLQFYFKTEDISKIVAVMFRLFKKDKTPFDGYVLEDYNYDIDIRSRIMLDQNISLFFQIREDFYKLNKMINNNYSLIFDIEDGDIEDLSQLTKKEQILYERNKKLKTSYSGNNAWFNIVYNLCKEDITKMNDILKMNIFTILKILKTQKEIYLSTKSSEKKLKRK
jgi:hypothetical protein